MDCVGPIIVFLVVVAQVVASVRKAQAEARRRAMSAPPPPLGHAPPPRTVHRDEGPDEQFEPEAEETPYEDVPPPPGPIVREIADLVPVATPFSEQPHRRTVQPQTVPIPDVVHRRRVVSLGRRRLRNAVILSEILSPPVALRSRPPGP